MAYSVNANAFITMFGDEVHHSFQQLESKLQGSVRTVRGVQGHQYNFPILGKGGVIKNKTATAELDTMAGIADTTSLTNGGTWYGDTDVTMAHSNVSATINTFATGEYIDDFDALKTNIDLRNAYAESIAGGMNRAVDGEIISALDAVANADTAGGAIIDCTDTATLDKAAILTAKKQLDSKSVPQSDRFLVLSPQGLNDLMSASSIVSSDFGVISNEALQTGNIGSLFGFNIIMSNELTATKTPNSGIACYAFHKNAIGCAVGKDMTTLVNYVPHKLSTLIAAEYSAGAVAVDKSGIVRIAVV
jgi:hypothetical protein